MEVAKEAALGFLVRRRTKDILIKGVRTGSNSNQEPVMTSLTNEGKKG